MRKLISYIVLGLAVIGFLYVWIQTGSMSTAFIIISIGLAWFFFEKIALLGLKTEDRLKDNEHKKAKADLKRVIDKNPTLR
ncbi:MAG: hypothetical protein ACFB10_23640 [Salibacteraceae bacterium]